MRTGTCLPGGIHSGLRPITRARRAGRQPARRPGDRLQAAGGFAGGGNLGGRNSGLNYAFPNYRSPRYNVIRATPTCTNGTLPRTPRPTCCRAPRRCAVSAASPTPSPTSAFMDELAVAANANPLAFRQKYLSDPRALAVLKAMAQQAGWGSTAEDAAARAAFGRGIAYLQYENFFAYVAAYAEVLVNPTDRQRAGHARGRGARLRPDHQSGRTEESDRGQRDPGLEPGAEGRGAVRRQRGHQQQRGPVLRRGQHLECHL